MGEDPPYAEESESSADVGAVEMENGSILLLGALRPGGRVRLEARALSGRYEEGEGEWFVAQGTEAAVFGAYAETLHRRLGGYHQPSPPRVWCSWYSLYYFINESLLLRALEGLNDLPFEVFQVDDGWQQRVGDWQPNRKFPSGMAALARQIRRAGRIPGLWLAPFLVHERSTLFQEHPDWLLHEEQGELVSAGYNWGGNLYALDTTHPAVQDWLAALMKQVRAWGYDYVKLDFLYAGALPGKRQQKISRFQAYRLGMEIIRQALGDAYLLACGAPILASLGLCDGLRISPDVAPYWINAPYHLVAGLSAPGLQNAIRTSLHRLWLRPLVHPDPDVSYFRRRAIRLTPEQQALQRDLAWICGFRATSDLPWWLGAAERAALRHFWEHQPQVEQVDRYRFRLDGRTVDFAPALALPRPRLRYPLAIAQQLGFLQDALLLGLPAILESRRRPRRKP